MTPAGETGHEHRIFLFSHSRTGSHLLERILSQQPDCSYASHFFQSAWRKGVQMRESGPLDSATQAQRDSLLRMHQGAFASLEAFLRDADAQGLTAFYHEHPHWLMSPALASRWIYTSGEPSGDEDVWSMSVRGETASPASHTNPTTLPDACLLHPNTVSVFLIRHPARMIPSIFRGLLSIQPNCSSKMLKMSGTLRWSRMLCDWRLQHAGAAKRTVIVDADDFVSDKRIVKKLCDATGLNETHAIYQWPKATAEELRALPPVEAEVKKVILASEGLERWNDAKNIVIEEEVAKWREEFGFDKAILLETLVLGAMPDYEHLHALRITSESDVAK